MFVVFTNTQRTLLPMQVGHFYPILWPWLGPMLTLGFTLSLDNAVFANHERIKHVQNSDGIYSTFSRDDSKDIFQNHTYCGSPNEIYSLLPSTAIIDDYSLMAEPRTEVY